MNRTTRQETRNVTIRGTTRAVTFEITTYEDGQEHCNSMKTDTRGAFSKGGKVWFGKLAFINNNGRTDWTVCTNAVFLNRNGYRLIGFEDEFRGKFDSKHNSA